MTGFRAVLLTLALLCLATAGAQARPHSNASSPAQVDGVLSLIVDRLWTQTDTYFHEGDYPRIIALDRIIAQADPHFVECFNTGAWLMWSDGLNADAEAFYKQGLRANPRIEAAYYDYGSFLFHHLKRYNDARRVFQRAALLPEATVMDWRMLAHCYEKLGQMDRAVVTWKQIKTRWPQGPPGDPTHGAVDTNNLNRDLAGQNAPPPTPAPQGTPTPQETPVP